jgi:dienelactone hydrolase
VVRAADEPLAARLSQFDAGVVVRGPVRSQPLAGMTARDVAARLRAAEQQDTAAWSALRSRADWEAFRRTRVDALRDSLGVGDLAPGTPRVRVTGTRDVDGLRIENVLIESRPGVVVAANVYRPVRATQPLPAIVVVHSHFQAKHSDVRQHMACTWARAGCVVCVPDLVGHGERRQHPFGEDQPHDYHFRYDAGIQLLLAGESLMGWHVRDLVRCTDMLSTRDDVDRRRILLVSEPAGGGDVAGTAAALDPRLAGALVNNFGGPEPENAYPLPRDAETSFPFASSGSWESTRNLRLSARDGFLPWTIVASIAPRKLVYYHEFSWDQDRDPVWKRLQRVWGWYDASTSLEGLAGRGFVVGNPPQNTHWIPLSREIAYPLLERWFAIPNPGRESTERRPPEQLTCLVPDLPAEFRPRPLHEVATEAARAKLEAARRSRGTLDAKAFRERTLADWTSLLGATDPSGAPVLGGLPEPPEALGPIAAERLHLLTEPGIVVPTLLLVPREAKTKRCPVVVGLAQEGKQEFLKRQAGPIGRLLEAGVAVCLADVRGTGESDPGPPRDRRSPAAGVTASEWMLGESLLGGRVRDLRAVLRHLRTRPDLDSRRIALWGESFAPVNPPDRTLMVAHAASERPPVAEPLGGLLAVLGALFEPDVRAVHVRGGLSDFLSVVAAQPVYVPCDVIVPDVLERTDLPDLAASLAPRPLRLVGPVDGSNRRVPQAELTERYALARASYERTGSPARLEIVADDDPSMPVDRWLLEQFAAP